MENQEKNSADAGSRGELAGAESERETGYLQFSTEGGFVVNCESMKWLVEAARAYTTARIKWERTLSSELEFTSEECGVASDNYTQALKGLIAAALALDAPPPTV